MYVNELLIIYQ